jgi:cytochrome c peroxidase
LALGLWVPLHSQGNGKGGGNANGNVIAPPVNPLGVVGVPDVNSMGLLEGSGPWPAVTKPGQRQNLRVLGKLFFGDMQVGGDGIQACASCHYHAGADHRKTGQMSPGFKGGDFVHDLMDNNGVLNQGHFGVGSPTPNRGLPVSEAALIAGGATPDAVNGNPGTVGTKPSANLDVNDVVSSQGPRGGTYHSLSGSRQDRATLRADDGFGAVSANPNRNGFNFNFSSNAPGIPDTVRRVEPRNSPSVLNAVYNMRNFWDGRADPFFNGRNPLGMRDPDARVKVATPTGLANEQLMIPFSSLASQAVGPLGSEFEMIFEGRPVMDIGKKLMNAQPLAGQLIACDDSLLAGHTDCSAPGVSNRGATGTYAARIQAIFQDRFWNSTLCVDVNGAEAPCGPTTYTLMEYNFPLFFGLAVQAYEATLFTEDTIVDLVVGGKATGTVTLGNRTVNVAGLSLEACIANLQANNSVAAVAAATTACANHYARFIHPQATSGSESNLAPNPVPANSPIGPTGNCTVPTSTTCVPRAAGASTLLNVDRGLGRFFAGATGCGICHFNPEFTGATVSTITGFGAGPAEPLPPGQARRLELLAAMERMVAFNALPAVYDTGFYNIGVRPTPEDISLRDSINGVPLAWSKLAEQIPVAAPGSTIAKIGALLPNLFLPTATNSLTPIPFTNVFRVACGPGLNNPNANNNPNVNCIPNVILGERLLRNGAFKAPGLRNVKFTGPYLHNGSKMNLRQVLEFYKTAGHFTQLNFNNLDAGMRVIALTPADEAAVVVLMETGLTDWRVAFDSGKFDHPELCIPNGHDPVTGQTIIVGIPATGQNGHATRLETFQEQLQGGNTFAHNLTAACTVPGIADANRRSLIDVPPAPLP